MRSRIDYVIGIVIWCGVMFVLAVGLSLPAVSDNNIITWLTLPTPDVLYRLGMSGTVAINAGRWWTLITANYLHKGVLHLGFNLFWLLRMGPWVKELFGGPRFWIIYTIAGVCGSVVSTLAGTPFFVGASGAIFGLFGALIYYGRYQSGTFGTAIFRQVSVFALIGLLFGFTQRGVDNWGHLGGFAAGLITAFIIGYENSGNRALSYKNVSFMLLIIVVASFILMALDGYVV